MNISLPVYQPIGGLHFWTCAIWQFVIRSWTGVHTWPVVSPTCGLLTPAKKRLLLREIWIGGGLFWFWFWTDEDICKRANGCFKDKVCNKSGGTEKGPLTCKYGRVEVAPIWNQNEIVFTKNYKPTHMYYEKNVCFCMTRASKKFSFHRRCNRRWIGGWLSFPEVLQEEDRMLSWKPADLDI